MTEDNCFTHKVYEETIEKAKKFKQDPDNAESITIIIDNLKKIYYEMRISLRKNLSIDEIISNVE